MCVYADTEHDELVGIQCITPDNEKCSIHNEPYTLICGCERLYCDKCDDLCDMSHAEYKHDIEYWKKQTLIEMRNFKSKLNNKINGLTCTMELIMNHNSIIKEIEDIIDTIFVDISHINNFNQVINDDNIPISYIIKRKNQILNNKITITININDTIPSHLIKFINIIIKNDGDIHYYVLEWASSNGHLDVVKCLIAHGADVHSENDVALQCAASNGNLDVVEFLIAHGADIHVNNDYALRWASRNGNLDVIECLIKHGANIHASNDQALSFASSQGHLGVIKCLIKYGANIQTINDLELRFASMNGHLDVVEYLTNHKTFNKWSFSSLCKWLFYN
jgi:ankyrin repeat protein